MQSLCQEECEVDVSILLRSRCQNEFQIKRSLCQEECEADMKILGSRARICWIAISTELGGNVSHASWVGKYPVQVVWERVPCKLSGTRSHLTQTENDPTQLARDTFHPTGTGHVPTQLWWDTFPPNSNGERSHPSILFQYSFQIMRTLSQEECKADVSILLRSRCQSECEADVRMNAKPMSI